MNVILGLIGVLFSVALCFAGYLLFLYIGLLGLDWLGFINPAVLG